MNAKQKKDYLARLNRIPAYPKYKHFHWADYIELLCLANSDNVLSEEDINDRLLERADLFEGNLHDGDSHEIGTVAEKNDNFKNQIGEWFNTIELRSTLYGHSYPFKFSTKEITRKKTLTSKQLTYIYLLLCSNLYLFDPRLRSTLANSFELLSLEIFKKVLPKSAEIHLFGSNPLNRNGRYSGRLTLWQKILRLADDLYLKRHPELSEADYPPFNRGDDGLDIVGWIPSGDTASGTLTFFGQCACSSEDWKIKQSEATYNSWSSKIIFTTYPSNVTFIPFCFRKLDGNWFKSGDIHKSFLIDRKRFLHYSASDNIINSLPAFSIISEIIHLEESIV